MISFNRAYNICYKNCSAFANYSRQFVSTHPTKIATGILSLSVGIGYWNWKNTNSNFNHSLTLSPQDTKVMKLRQEWENQNFYHQSISHTKAANILISRAEQIKEIYKDTHYVFIHGQSTSFYPFICLINADAEDRVTKNPLFKYMRELGSEYSLPGAILTSKLGDDHSNHVRDNILSADLYFPHNANAESALYFLRNDLSIREDIGWLTDRMLKHKGFDSTTTDIIGRKIQTLGESLRAVSPCGNLFVVCIPKSIFQDGQASNIAYRSHPFGQLCCCHQGNDMEIAQKLQDNILDESTQCKVPLSGRKPVIDSYSGEDMMKTWTSNDPVPQYRLVISALTPENGVRSFLLTPLSKGQRKAIKQKVKKTVEDPAYNPTLPFTLRKNTISNLCEKIRQLWI